jgi:hypothetical protein
MHVENQDWNATTCLTSRCGEYSSTTSWTFSSSVVGKGSFVSLFYCASKKHSPLINPVRALAVLFRAGLAKHSLVLWEMYRMLSLRFASHYSKSFPFLEFSLSLWGIFCPRFVDPFCEIRLTHPSEQAIKETRSWGWRFH